MLQSEETKQSYGIGFCNMSIYKILLVCWFFILMILTGLLVSEYKYFRETANQLSQLKDDYSSYIVSLKKLISDQQNKEQFDSEIKTQDQKKKMIENIQTFLIVNRESRYLKKSAISFAKLHKLERAIEKLYKADEWIETNDTLNSKRNIKVSRKTNRKKSLNSHKALQRESIFAWPIKKGKFRLSSLFGPRKHNGQWKPHMGIDLAAMAGTPVQAAADGIIIEAGYLGGFGNTIVISHDRKYKTRYAHLSSIRVRVGQRVDRFDVIGKVGATGNVRSSRPGGSGSHLHFEVSVFDKQVNPFYFLA